jgi:CheY-like chemotaxis protein
MTSKLTILIAEDEESDFMLLQKAFRKNNIDDNLVWVRDGLDAIDYLQGSGAYSDRQQHPAPELVILDLKMPRMSGLEVLQWVKDHPEFKVIPTIVMSSSRLDDDVRQAYDLGANTYFIKPTDFATLVRLIQGVHQYWSSGVRPSDLQRRS